MRGRSIVVLLCAGLLCIAGSPSLADGTAFGDENDAYGPLDIKRMSHGHGSDAGDLVHRLSTYGKWDRDTLDSADSEIQILFTTDGDNKPERVLLIDAQGNRMIADMHEWKNGVGTKVYGSAGWSRTGPRGIMLVFERKLLGKKVKEYGWHVDTRFHDQNHGRCKVTDGVIVVCPDSAPNSNSPRSYLRHQL